MTTISSIVNLIMKALKTKAYVHYRNESTFQLKALKRSRSLFLYMFVVGFCCCCFYFDVKLLHWFTAHQISDNFVAFLMHFPQSVCFNAESWHLAYSFFFLTDLIVVVSSIIVLIIGSTGEVFGTSAVRYVLLLRVALHTYRDIKLV